MQLNLVKQSLAQPSFSREVVVRFILIALMSIFVQPVYAVDCDNDTLNINEGDVVSADLLNDILSQIRGVTVGLSNSELDGTWTCTSFNRDQGTINGYVNHADGIGAYVTQDIDFTLQSNSTFSVTYDHNLGQNSVSTGSSTCSGKLIDGGLFVLTGNDCDNAGLYGMKKISKSCFVWEVTNSFPLASATTCTRKNELPLAPTSLSVTSGSNGNQLSWTAGDDTASSYKVMSKDGASDEFTELGTATSTSFTDTSTNRSRQYRVFAVNDNGTSIGSNVVSLD
jgi:hypothetical protein